ncbi:MAG: MlaD family protein [Fermentimonas sp.]|jgi:phospholipid/cholesterol/gamma-HCH transport system substrate-binding protein
MKKNSKLSKNALIGLAFIASLAMIYFGINFLKGVNIFTQQNIYYASFDDVSKLLSSSPIYLKGYQVGLINEINITDKKGTKFVAELNLKDKIDIPVDSYVEYESDLFGSSTVSLVLGSSENYLNLGDTLIGRKKIGIMDQVESVVPTAQLILSRVDSVVYTLNRLISDPAWEKSMNGINNTVDQLSMSSRNINNLVSTLEKEWPEITQNISTVTRNLKDVSDEIDSLDFNAAYASIDETLTNLKSITSKINSNDNSLGLLLNDTKLHDSLNMTIDSATRLLEDIRENPDRYLTIRLKLF